MAARLAWRCSISSRIQSGVRTSIECAREVAYNPGNPGFLRSTPCSNLYSSSNTSVNACSVPSGNRHTFPVREDVPGKSPPASDKPRFPDTRPPPCSTPPVTLYGAGRARRRGRSGALLVSWLFAGRRASDEPVIAVVVFHRAADVCLPIGIVAWRLRAGGPVAGPSEIGLVESSTGA